MKKEKYGIRSLKKDFPDEVACLNFIFDTLHSRKCECGGTYAPLFHMLDGKFYGRRQFQCSSCRFQIAPCAGTIFHKSDTPLTLWFHALLVFSNAKSGISSRELMRQLEVTYKTAWRMLHLIKKALPKDDRKLRGDVEIDLGYFGRVGKAGRDNRYLSRVMEEKSILIVASERGGRMKAELASGTGTRVMEDFIKRNIDPKNTTLYTDNSTAYKSSDKEYDRVSVTHRRREWVRGDAHVNTIETFFAHLKRSIKGTFKSVSKQYLQDYLDSFVWHRNNSYSDKARFSVLLGGVLRFSK